MLLELFLVVYFFKAAKSGLGSAAAFALHEVDPDEVSALGLADLFRAKHCESGTLVKTFHVSYRFSSIVDRVQKLAPLAVITVADFRVMKLLTQLGHVVAWDVFLLLKFSHAMGEGAVVSKFTFAKVDHVFTHFRLFLFFNVRVEFLPFLVIREGFLDFLACCLAISLVSGRGMIGVCFIRAVVGGAGIVSTVINFMSLVLWHKGVELLVLLFVMLEASHHLLALTLQRESSFVE